MKAAGPGHRIPMHKHPDKLIVPKYIPLVKNDFKAAARRDPPAVQKLFE
jgi:hypothetical protein